MISVGSFYLGIGIVFLLVLSGCVQQSMRPLDPMYRPNNSTLLLKCNRSCTIRLRVEGNVFIGAQDLAASNCSAHTANRSLTIVCPRAELSFSERAAMAGSLIPSYS